MPKKKAPPKTKAAPKKRPVASKGVRIAIDLGPLAKATKAQRRRLKELLENHVVTWVRSDLKSDFVPPIASHEFMRPPDCDDDE